jgi:choline dehydrogenase-like flavoprotein
MALARGPAADYDEWPKMVGDDGWKWENILPLMKQGVHLGRWSRSSKRGESRDSRFRVELNKIAIFLLCKGPQY